MGGDYLRYQTFFASKVRDLTITALDNPATRVIATPQRATEQIYVQKISVYPSTFAAATMTFQDGAGVAIGTVSIPATAPTADVGYQLDFGPTGTPLTLGQTLVVVHAGASLACRIHVEAYERLGVVTAA